jgi:hypothetical protein
MEFQCDNIRPMPIRRRSPLILLPFVILIVLFVVLAFPWAFHIGGRWTPLLTWIGSGKLRTQGGNEYPLFLWFHPSSHSSRLRLDGRRPSAGLGGSACLCVAPGMIQTLNLSGTIYGIWRSTEDALMAFRLLEPTIVDVGQARAGYFDLVGRWKGGELVMEDRGNWSRAFRSGLRIEHASVTLHWNTFWTCKAACESASTSPAH